MGRVLVRFEFAISLRCVKFVCGYCEVESISELMRDKFWVHCWGIECAGRRLFMYTDSVLNSCVNLSLNRNKTVEQVKKILLLRMASILYIIKFAGIVWCVYHFVVIYHHSLYLCYWWDIFSKNC